MVIHIRTSLDVIVWKVNPVDDKRFCPLLRFTVNTWDGTGTIFDGYSDCQIVEISSKQVELHRCGEQAGFAQIMKSRKVSRTI